MGISIHALLAESDAVHRMGISQANGFLSTLSLRRATVYALIFANTMLFLSTLSLRRATSLLCYMIHLRSYFYPRSPCGERRGGHVIKTRAKNFYPRSPCGERHAPNPHPCHCNNFYPRSPCGERHGITPYLTGAFYISIHALLAESDQPATRPAQNLSNFYPRSPCGERPSCTGTATLPEVISIHALLAESDPAGAGCPAQIQHFYPRSPCGERQDQNCASSSGPLFLSTLSLRRATLELFLYYQDNTISIHALLAESDLRVLDGSKSSIISIHALLAESDKPSIQVQHLPKSISIHALLAESDLAVAFMTCPPPDFYPRSPCGERRKPRRLKSRRCVFLSTLSLRRATHQE